MRQPDEGLFSTIRAAAPEGGRAFLHCPDGRLFTYADMLALSGRIANELDSLGLAPGDRLAVQVEKSAEAIMLYLACLRAGAVYLPLNPAYTLAELEYFLGDSEPAFVIVAPETFDTVAPLATRSGAKAILTLGADGRTGSVLEGARTRSDDFADFACAPDDLAAILYTSGTTGRSKGAMITQRNLASNAAVLKDAWRFTRDDVLLHTLPLYHTHGLFTATNTMLMAGASMILLPKYDVDQIFAFLPGSTAMMGVPTYYGRLLNDLRLAREAVAHMRIFISGSAPLSAATHKAWFERTGHAILERYGMTETGMNTSNPYNGDRIAGTVGFPLPRTELRIVDPEIGAAVPQGQIGVIEVRGPNVFKGYWRRLEKTSEEFRRDGFFITGDLGTIDALGYLRIVGRAKDIVITGGLNVYPKEVEAEIDSLAGVLECAVIGIPHADLGECVTAAVVRAPRSAVSESDVLDALICRLARYKVPRRVVFVDALPRNAMGKVQKSVLREIYGSLYRWNEQ